MNDAFRNIIQPMPNDRPSLLDNLKVKFFQAVNHKAGTFVQWAVGAFIGWATAKLLSLGIAITDDLKLEATQFGMAAGAFAVSTLIQYLQSKANMKVQAHLGVEQDGWIGPQTVRRAEIVNDVLNSAEQP